MKLTLSELCDNKLTSLQQNGLRTIPLELLNTVMKPFMLKPGRTHDDIINVVISYGRIAYNHLYLALILTVPWIETTWSKPISLYKDESNTLAYTNTSSLFSFLWIRVKDDVIKYASPALYLDIFTCLNEGYLLSDNYCTLPWNDDWCYLAVMNYDITFGDDVTQIPISNMNRSDTFIEMPCGEGWIRVIDPKTGIIIEKSPYVIDFTYNEYLIVNNNKYIYSACDDLCVIMNDVVRDIQISRSSMDV